MIGNGSKLIRLRLLCVAVLVGVQGTSVASRAFGQETLPDSEVTLRRGNLSAKFRDNSQSPAVLSGIQSLFNVQDAAEFDAFDPHGAGASAGLNFEHIISGHPREHNAFSPRHGPYSLHVDRERHAVELRRRAQDSPWKVESTLRYNLVEPHYIDFQFRCIPHDATKFGDRRYAIFFFANYMNDVEDAAIHFRGREFDDRGTPVGEEKWIRGDAPQQHADWIRGGNYRAVEASPLYYDDDVKFRLNTWSYDSPRIAQPFFFGKAANDMTLILMFDRLHTERDQIRFSLYKFKLPDHPRPAWDFQYVIPRVQSRQEYGFRGRLVWKKFVSADDCQAEYQRWVDELEAARARQQRNVARLREVGATVFLERDRVTEVNANRTKITDDDLSAVSNFVNMTDLSLEETTIGDEGLAHLKALQNLQWLNLYRTRVGNRGVRRLLPLKALQHLPVGETEVTDDGLIAIGQMKQLQYLGLKANDVSDRGVKHLQGLSQLTGLHLGGTKISDAAIRDSLPKLEKLEKLWLDDTGVTDQSVAELGRMTSLRELHVARTKLSAKGISNLRLLLPRCRVITE